MCEDVSAVADEPRYVPRYVRCAVNNDVRQTWSCWATSTTLAAADMPWGKSRKSAKFGVCGKVGSSLITEDIWIPV